MVALAMTNTTTSTRHNNNNNNIGKNGTIRCLGSGDRPIFD